MTRTIKVDYLARVEGEGALFIKIEGEELRDVKLKIFEPPRFFEAFLQGRQYTEVPDITARICGICPIAYQMSSVHAMEQACDVKVEGALRDLRRLIYCGEWIESHVLHVFMLHAPDFLGYQDAIAMAKDYPDIVKSGLELKKIGNEIVQLVGGREIHPINVRVGGFYKAPSKKDMQKLGEKLQRAKEIALEAIPWIAKFKFYDFEQDYEFVALKHQSEYPFNEGRIVSSKGLNIPIEEFNEHFEEVHVEHSNALHCVHKGKGSYFVGPLARYNLNFDQLSEDAIEAAASAGLKEQCKNPFKGILVRMVEVVYACDEAMRIISEYEELEKPFVDVKPKAGIGHGCTEAPRGILYHQYKIDDAGSILKAQIVPPTSQNQMQIENDLKEYIQPRLNLTNDQLTWECEQAVRNYDPCISCATHFLKLEIDRS